MAKKATNTIMNKNTNANIEEGNPIYLTGTSYYFFATHPDTAFNPEGRYKINLVCDEESLQIARDNGITVNPPKPDKIPGEWITASSKFAPTLIDANRDKIEGKLLVGNGSKVRIRAVPIKFAKGVGLRLKMAQILDLVPYEPKDRPGFTKDQGTYRVNDTTAGGDNLPEEAF